MAKRIRTNFDDDFKRKAATLAGKLGSQKAAAIKLGVSEVNIHNWVKRFGVEVKSKGEPETRRSSKRSDEVLELREIVKRLEKDNAMLRQIVASLSLEYVKKN